MKKYLLYLACLLPPIGSAAQESVVDPTAVLLLDRMSAVIGSLSACSFNVDVSNDILDNTFFVPMEGVGLVKHFSTSEVHLSGHNKMLVNTRGDRGHQGYWYNGDQLAWYHYDEKNYVIVEAPDSTVQMMYELNETYGIEFPAADFFNPYFTDDLLEHSDQVRYIGTSNIRGKPCFQITATSEARIVQLWIADDAMSLPVKMVIVYRDKEDHPQYEATFSDWRINPILPAAMFEFLPPPRASKVAIAVKEEQ